MNRPALLGLAIAVGLAAPALSQEAPTMSVRATLGVTDGRTMSPYLTALSRDGTQLAYRIGPDTIGIFEPLTGKRIRTVAITEKEVGEQLHYSPDSKYLILQAMQQFRLVDPATGAVLRTIGGDNQFDIYSHAFNWNNDCSRLTDRPENFNFNNKPTVKVWDGANRRALGEIDVAPNGGGRCEAISGDGKLIATSGRFHRKEKETDENVTEYVELWDAATRRQTGRIHMGKDAYAVMLGLNADGKYLVVVSENNDGAVIWDTARQEKVATLGRFPGGYGRIIFSPDDKHFAIQSILGYTGVYETATGKKVAERKDSGRVPAGVGFNPQGDIIACFVDVSHVRISVVNKQEQPILPKPVGHAQPVFLTRFADDGKTMLTVGRDGKVLRWDVDTGKLRETVIEESGSQIYWDNPSTFSPDGRFLVVASFGSLMLFDVEEKKKIANLATQNTKYTTRFASVDFTQDGRKLIARGEGQERRQDFKIVIVGYAASWTSADGQLVAELSDAVRDDGNTAFAKHFAKETLFAPEPPKNAPEVTVGPALRDPWASSRNAGAMNIGNKITVKDRTTRKLLLDRLINANAGHGISFSPDGKRMALPLNDNTVQIFDLP